MLYFYFKYGEKELMSDVSSMLEKTQETHGNRNLMRFGNNKCSKCQMSDASQMEKQLVGYWILGKHQGCLVKSSVIVDNKIHITNINKCA